MIVSIEAIDSGKIVCGVFLELQKAFDTVQHNILLHHLFDYGVNSFILLYADDILLITSSVTAWQKLLLVCETELNYLDMTINSKKSSCIPVGSRHDKTCANIVTCDGSHLAWVDELRYLGIFIVRAPVFRCSLEHAKPSFYCVANGIFGKIGRIAFEEVTIQLLKSKCLPLLLYDL